MWLETQYIGPPMLGFGDSHVRRIAYKTIELYRVAGEGKSYIQHILFCKSNVSNQLACIFFRHFQCLIRHITGMNGNVRKKTGQNNSYAAAAGSDVQN